MDNASGTGTVIAKYYSEVYGNRLYLSLGRVMDGGNRYLVRSVSEFQNAEAIGNMPLMGGEFRLRDIGEVVYGFPDKTQYERLDGVDALQLEIFKSSPFEEG